MKIVAQWKNYRWVNFCDEDGNARYFESADDAKSFLKTRHFSRDDVEVRICEYMGGRTYKEIEPPQKLKEYKR